MDLAEQFSAEHRDLLLELSLLLSERRGVDEIFASFAAHVRHGVTFDFTSLFVATEDPTMVRTVGNFPQFPGAWEPGSLNTAPDTGADKVAVEVDGTEYNPSRIDIEATRALAAQGYQRAWAMPLYVDGENYGMLSVAKKTPGHFPPDHIRFLRLAAKLLASAVRQDLELGRAQRNAARAEAANALVLALQAGEPIDDIFKRLPALLEGCLDVDYIGLILDQGAGFMVVAEVPAGVHTGAPPRREGDIRIRELAEYGDFIQFRPEGNMQYSDALAQRGFGRCALAFLRDGDEVRGVLLLGRDARRKFNTDEQGFIELLRSILSQSVANQRRIVRSEAAAARARTLNEIALLLNAGEAIDAIFERLVDLLGQSLDVDHIGLLEAVDDGKSFRAVKARHPLLVQRGGVVTAVEAGLGQLIASGVPLFQYSLSRFGEATEFAQSMKAAGMKRAVSLVIRHAETVQGVLSLSRANPARFAEDEEAFLKTLSAMLGEAMEATRRLQQARTEAARNALLRDLAILLNNGESLTAFFESLTRQLQQAVPFGGLVLMVEEAQPETYRVVQGLRGRSFTRGQVITKADFGEHVLGRFAAGEYVVEGDTADLGGAVALAARSNGTIRGAVASIRNGTDVVGYLLLGRVEDEPFSENERSFIEIVSTLAGQAIANLKKVREREAQAIRSRVLSELSLLLEGGESIESHFAKVSEILLEAVGFDFLSIVTKDPVSGGYAYIRTHELLVDGRPLEFEPEHVPPAITSSASGMQYATAARTDPAPRALNDAGFERAVTVAIAGPAASEGLLTIGRKQDVPFTEEEMAFIGLLTALFGQASANHQKAYSRKAEAARNRVLGELALIVNNGDPIESHFKRLAQLLSDEQGFDFCALTARVADGSGYRLMRSHELPGDDGEPHPERIDVLRGANLHSIQYGPDAASAQLPTGLFEIGIGRAATVLMLAGSSAEGLLTVGRLRPDSFTAEEMTFFELISTLLAYAVANEGRIAQSEAEAEEQAIIAEAAAAVARENDALAIVRSLRTAVGRFIPSPYVTFGFLDPGVVSFITREGSLDPLPIGEYFTRAFAEGQVLVPATAERVRAGERIPDMEELGVQAHVLTTAHSAGTIVGILLVGSRDESFVPGPRETRFCRLIADILGPAMANARATERERLDAEDQRMLAEIGAAVSREASPQQIMAAVRLPFHALVPQPFVFFGFREGNEIVFTRIDGSSYRVALGQYAVLIDQEGQIHGDGIPEDLGLKELSSIGINAICATGVRAGGDTVGYFLVGSRSPEFKFQERELAQCRRIAQIVGPAMQNARAATRAHLDAEEQSILAEAASALATGATVASLADALVAPVRRVVPGSIVSVFFLEGDELINPAGLGGRLGPRADEVLVSGQEVVAKPWPELSQMGHDMLTQAGVEKFVLTALSAAGESRGLLFAGSVVPNEHFSERQLRLLRLICDMAGPAFANAREAARRLDEADEQRILAIAASAAARAEDESALVKGLVAPIKMALPGARIDLLSLDSGGLRSVITGELLRIGVYFSEALECGESTANLQEAVAPGANYERRQQTGVRRSASFRLSSGGQPLGVLWVGTVEAEAEFGERQLRLYRLIADIVGPALANLRESARRREDAEEQRILAEAAASIAAGTSELDILQRLIVPVRSFVPRARISFSYVEGGEMWVFDGRHRRPVHSHAARALAEGQALGDIDETEITQPSRDLIVSVKVKQWVDTASHSGGAAVGLLFVGTPEREHVFSQRDLRVFRLIADVIGPAMLNSREEARRVQDADDERLISEIASVAARATDSGEIIEALPRVLSTLVPGAFALYGHIDGDTITYQLTDPLSRELIGSDQLGLAMTETGRVARDRGQASGDLTNVPAAVPYSKLGLKEYVLTSYASTGSPVGVLLVSTTEADFHFNERFLALFRRLAQVVGPAVEASRAEAERARQADLYSLMLRSLSEGVVLADFEGKMVFANSMGRTILRNLDPAGTAKSWHDIVELLPEDARESYRAVYERGEGSRGRTHIVVDGQDAWFDYELVPLNDPVMKILLVAADVTADVERENEQLRHREQLEHASRLAALGELVGGVAHELNNPLTAILGFAEVMSLSPDAAPLAEDLAVIQKEALRARNIVRDLLFIVRPGTSERSLIPMVDLIGHIERLRRTSWAQQGIAWEIDIQEPCRVWGNEHQLTQVMLNLVTNAEHALAESPNKQIIIRAATRGGRTEISVTDTGAGMDEATRGRVFEPFFTTKQGHGTGLGLPLSYSIIQSHSGEISIVSKVDEGTTFSISLPAVDEAPGTTGNDGADAEKTPLRVLVVDDEPSLRKVCQRLIASMGHECSTAENSATAVELARNVDFDVVLCDYRLATETANDVVAGLEKVAPQLVDRIVIATGATTDPGVLELTERYHLKLIAKPYGVDELAAVLQRAS
ncbi:MAG: GAF domain-containing protein [bacterium]